MVKRYYEKRSLSIKTVEIFECPDCGFEFNAMHEVDEQVGGWECPLCEVDELKKKIDVAIDELGYAWRTGNDGLKDDYIKNAIRFLEED